MADTALTIREAIAQRRSLSTIYDDYLRHFSPLVLGKDRNGISVVVGFQYDGGRREKLPTEGAWCCFEVGRMRGIAINDDPWNPGPAGGPDIDLAEIEAAVSRDEPPRR